MIQTSSLVSNRVLPTYPSLGVRGVDTEASSTWWDHGRTRRLTSPISLSVPSVATFKKYPTPSSFVVSNGETTTMLRLDSVRLGSTQKTTRPTSAIRLHMWVSELIGTGPSSSR